MKQEDFDKKIDVLSEKVSGLGAKLDDESVQIADIVAGYKDEIRRLKDSQGDDIDTSRLDELNNSLDSVGTRIGNLVEPLSAAVEEASAPAAAAEVLTEENQNQSSEAASTETSATETSEGR